MKIGLGALCFLLAVSFSCTACGATSQTVAEDAANGGVTADQSSFIWKIEIHQVMAAQELSTTQFVVQYTGDTAEILYEDVPAQGKVFLLIEMTVAKQAVGAASFSWSNCYVLDENENRYNRHPNDTFLENHNYKRLKAVDLMIGENKGYACFEIPISAQKLWLVYEEDDRINKLEVNV